jgi:hypothetical protein
LKKIATHDFTIGQDGFRLFATPIVFDDIRFLLKEGTHLYPLQIFQNGHIDRSINFSRKWMFVLKALENLNWSSLNKFGQNIPS